jgi:hypothetical protein
MGPEDAHDLPLGPRRFTKSRPERPAGRTAGATGGESFLASDCPAVRIGTRVRPGSIAGPAAWADPALPCRVGHHLSAVRTAFLHRDPPTIWTTTLCDVLGELTQRRSRGSRFRWIAHGVFASRVRSHLDSGSPVPRPSIVPRPTDCASYESQVASERTRS